MKKIQQIILDPSEGKEVLGLHQKKLTVAPAGHGKILFEIFKGEEAEASVQFDAPYIAGIFTAAIRITRTDPQGILARGYARQNARKAPGAAFGSAIPNYEGIAHLPLLGFTPYRQADDFGDVLEVFDPADNSQGLLVGFRITEKAGDSYSVLIPDTSLVPLLSFAGKYSGMTGAGLSAAAQARKIITPTSASPNRSQRRLQKNKKR